MVIGRQALAQIALLVAVVVAAMEATALILPLTTHLPESVAAQGVPVGRAVLQSHGGPGVVPLNCTHLLK